jgi:hypothetical protein
MPLRWREIYPGPITLLISAAEVGPAALHKAVPANGLCLIRLQQDVVGYTGFDNLFADMANATLTRNMTSGLRSAAEAAARYISTCQHTPTQGLLRTGGLLQCRARLLRVKLWRNHADDWRYRGRRTGRLTLPIRGL